MTVDARGYSCPMPVVMVQKAVKADAPATLEVLVDNQCASTTLRKDETVENDLGPLLEIELFISDKTFLKLETSFFVLTKPTNPHIFYLHIFFI